MSTSSDRGARRPARASRGRRVAVRGLLVAGVALPGLYLTSVLTDALGLTAAHRVGSPDDPAPSAEALAGAATPGEAVHVTGAVAVLVTLLVGAVALLVRPDRPASAAYVLATSGALVPAALIIGDPDNHGGQAGAVDPLFLALPVPAALAALLAGPWAGSARGRAPRTPLLGLATVAAGPVAWWGVHQALLQRNTFPPTADPHHNSHWYVMAVLAFLVVLLSAAAGLSGDRWRLPAGMAALDALAVAIASLIAPQSASALDPHWSAAVLVWALATGALVVRDGTRPRTPHIDHHHEGIHP